MLDIYLGVVLISTKPYKVSLLCQHIKQSRKTYIDKADIGKCFVLHYKLNAASEYSDEKRRTNEPIELGYILTETPRFRLLR